MLTGTISIILYKFTRAGLEPSTASCTACETHALTTEPN